MLRIKSNNVTINIGGIEYKLRCLKTAIVSEHLCVFESFFETNLLIKLYDSVCNNDNDTYCKVLKWLYARSIFSLDNFINTFTFNGVYAIWNGTGFRWPPEISNYKKSTFRGIARPEHSIIMKEKMKVVANNRSDEHKKNLENFLKNKYWYTRAINLNLIREEDSYKYTVEELKIIVSAALTEIKKTNASKIKRVQKFIKNKKYTDNEAYNKFIEIYENKITDDNIEDSFTQMYSIISSVAILNNPTMGNTKFFKSGILNVKFCENKTIIKYRSSYELDTILFFESSGIYYMFEPLYIPLSNGYLYLPDFILPKKNNIADKDIILEIKGFIRGAEGKKKEEMKKLDAVNYCKENNFKYCYSLGPITKIEQIKKFILWD